MNKNIDYKQGAFKDHPQLVKQLKDGNGRVFAHTNRSLWRTSKTSQYSIHPLKKKQLCGTNVVYKDLYPYNIVLKDVNAHFDTTQRNRIVRSVQKRIDECRDFTGVARTVYGGLCGELWAVNDNMSVRDLLDDPNLMWKKAMFPQTFPNARQYEAYLASNCKDKSLVDWDTWHKFNQISSWFYHEEDSLVPFKTADAAVLVGSNEPTPFPKWGVFVLSPA